MKGIVPALLLTLGHVAAIAAPLGNRPKTAAQQQHMAMYNALLKKQQTTNAAHKATAVNKRVIANSYTTGGNVVDSNHYYYSNGRSFTHDDVNDYYDGFYLTALDAEQTIKSDSSVNWRATSSMGLMRMGTLAYTYDASDRPVKQVSRSAYYYTEYTAAYNTAGKLSEVTILDTFGGTPMIPKSRMYIMYDANGRRTYDSTYSLAASRPSGKRIYTYDANGNRLRFDSYMLTGSAPILAYVNINTYDASNRLVTTTSQMDYMGTGTLENTSRDSFGYTGTNTRASYHLSQVWNVVDLEWVNSDAILSHYNAQNLLDTYYVIEYHVGTGPDTLERDVHTYDADGLLLKSNGYFHMGNGIYSATPYDESRQYFEEYGPTAIGSIAENNSSIIVYPNPASSVMTIEAPIAATGNIVVTDAMGRRMYYAVNTKAHKLSIDISTYPAGKYFITVSGNDDTVRYSTSFIKHN